MIATFRETWTSLGDFRYSSTIVGKTAGQAMWYWTKYLLLLVAILFVLSLGLLVYYTPQLPRLLNKNLPDIQLSVKKGQVSTNVKEPYVMGDANFSFIINTKGTIDDLNGVKSGALLLKDKIVVKFQDGQSRIQDLSDVGDLTLDKKTIIGWVTQNKSTLLTTGLFAILILLLFMSSFYWAWKILTLLLWSLLFYLAAVILKRTVTYVDTLKLTLYASVLPLFISAFSFFSPDKASSLISLAVFTLYTSAWIHKLPTKAK